MPQLDGTGPRGEGPRTGRGMGNCPEGKNDRPVRGRNRGCGLGRRFAQGDQKKDSE